jgi:hypothetical protein
MAVFLWVVVNGIGAAFRGVPATCLAASPTSYRQCAPAAIFRQGASWPAITAKSSKIVARLFRLQNA